MTNLWSSAQLIEQVLLYTLRRPFMLAVVTLRVAAILLVACSPTQLMASDLAGCWKAERTSVLLPDWQEKVNDTGNCVLEFTTDRITSNCRVGSEGVVIEYSYQVIRDGVYNATMLAHSNAQSEKVKAQVGGSREFEFRIEGDRLFLITFPQTTKPKPSSPFVKVQSVLSRVPC